MVVATWNLENLFRPGSGEGPGEEQTYEAKLTELARVIGDIDPDAQPRFCRTTSASCRACASCEK